MDLERLGRALRDPVGVLRRRLALVGLLLRFGGMRGARAERFWGERHARFGADDLRGVGRESWTHEDNARDYAQAWEVVRGACGDLDLARARVLDVGCGTGFYAERLRAAGAVDYTGVDIAPTLLPGLAARLAGFRFRQADLTRERPGGGPYDLVLMIDVTQHIVTDEGFAAATGHLRQALAPGGLLLVTSWLVPRARRLSFFERARPLSAYREAFPPAEFDLAAPLPFRGKWLLRVRRRQVAP